MKACCLIVWHICFTAKCLISHIRLSVRICQDSLLLAITCAQQPSILLSESDGWQSCKQGHYPGRVVRAQHCWVSHKGAQPLETTSALCFLRSMLTDALLLPVYRNSLMTVMLRTQHSSSSTTHSTAKTLHQSSRMFWTQPHARLIQRTMCMLLTHQLCWTLLKMTHTLLTG